jgi:RecB family exonuclease
MKLQHLSASRIKTFELCPMQYHAKYDLGMKEAHTHPLTIMGKVLHKMFEVSTNARLSGRREALHDPFAVKEAAIRKYQMNNDLRATLDELTQNTLDWGYFRKIGQCYSAEEKFDEVLPDGTHVIGFIDRLDLPTITTADIIDLKTQKRKFTTEQLEENWQADIYNWALRKKMPAIKGDVSVSFWVVRHHVQRVTRTADDAKRTEERLMAVAEEIRSCEEPDMRPTALCNWCLYKDECPTKNENLKQRLKRKMVK